MKLDSVVVRRCREGCYRLTDAEGGLLGCAPSFASLVRFVVASGVRARFAGQDEPKGWLGRLLRRAPRRGAPEG